MPMKLGRNRCTEGRYGVSVYPILMSQVTPYLHAIRQRLLLPNFFKGDDDVVASAILPTAVRAGASDSPELTRLRYNNQRAAPCVPDRILPVVNVRLFGGCMLAQPLN